MWQFAPFTQYEFHLESRVSLKLGSYTKNSQDLFLKTFLYSSSASCGWGK